MLIVLRQRKSGLISKSSWWNREGLSLTNPGLLFRFEKGAPSASHDRTTLHMFRVDEECTDCLLSYESLWGVASDTAKRCFVMKEELMGVLDASFQNSAVDISRILQD